MEIYTRVLISDSGKSPAVNSGGEEREHGWHW